MERPTEAVIYQILSRTEDANATMDHLMYERMSFPGAKSFTKNQLLFAVYWLEENEFVFRSTDGRTTRYFRTTKGNAKLAETERIHLNMTK
ncbi:DUF3116 family protein [Listeria ivanovii]|uniref:DUF3116 domain-containing protein n=1 Tax=Listeria ivanovii (strain ATCC BAA-678 / PAM 55) TaxID=881621 RepID=G2ZCF6_LISIP|nr:DUF3116 family protein [Listeria ivanovii]AHI55136.1 hypothetical protein AX25_03110 [Listeria ivanovii WSLC3009]AIS64595.1 hypothetical protein JL52_03045 [Listeria ivanovii subsp. ivanovii]MBC1758719.1 DUF3116 family protein [Listeria ivanovii]MBK3913591.1 DUF3116 family protein [Listeria ivanovii subsp. ivanovii]MBK3920291.1 DUF3116 family protein [Listeria ivanovii subsp. ivanovii]